LCRFYLRALDQASIYVPWVHSIHISPQSLPTSCLKSRFGEVLHHGHAKVNHGLSWLTIRWTTLEFISRCEYEVSNDGYLYASRSLHTQCARITEPSRPVTDWYHYSRRWLSFLHAVCMYSGIVEPIEIAFYQLKYMCNQSTDRARVASRVQPPPSSRAFRLASKSLGACMLSENDPKGLIRITRSRSRLLLFRRFPSPLLISVRSSSLGRLLSEPSYELSIKEQSPQE
jgi:hypothetical protein